MKDKTRLVTVYRAGNNAGKTFEMSDHAQYKIAASGAFVRVKTGP